MEEIILFGMATTTSRVKILATTQRTITITLCVDVTSLRRSQQKAVLVNLLLIKVQYINYIEWHHKRYVITSVGQKSMRFQWKMSILLLHVC